jgi:hypothetical protein
MDVSADIGAKEPQKNAAPAKAGTWTKPKQRMCQAP